MSWAKFGLWRKIENAVTTASAEIDRELATDASAKGRSLSEGLLVYDAPPLRDVFSVSDPDRKVEIARVRLPS
jgi:hypothetical protein